MQSKQKEFSLHQHLNKTPKNYTTVHDLHIELGWSKNLFFLQS